MAEPLDEPLGVVADDELADEPSRLGEILKAMQIQALLLERPHEALDDAVALGLADVRRRDRHAEPLHLVDPGVGDVLRPPVAANPEPARDVLREATEDVAHALAEGPVPAPAPAPGPVPGPGEGADPRDGGAGGAPPYTPDTPLPRDANGRPVPDSPYPHTQLGKRTSPTRGETYPQAREFGPDGKVVRDIDWTDHDRPREHTNPHQHIYNPGRGGPQPFP